ncbi:MAG TPA: phospholipase D-like domain-containing protein [Polyangiaceae bacterium]
MSSAAREEKRHERAAPGLRELADRMFSRAAGAPLIGGNQVRLLEDGSENYPAWLAAIRAAKDHVHFENYFIQDDEVGREFAEAFMARAREGVRVRIVYDWVGALGKAPRAFWRALRGAGVEVRVHNPPQLSSPLGWISRDHRKTLIVDGTIGFVTGLCVGRMWLGDPARNVAPWRDSGVEIRGPAVAEIARAFARSWALAGSPLPEMDPIREPPRAGDVSLRIVSSEPATASLLRLDQLVAAIARSRLWLTDAYYSGISSYVQALRAAAKDGVDVRLLVPNGTDIPILKPFSRAGYRALLEAGIRVFEWNGTMLHAKTAVADGRWARVGSTNLNIASWLGNHELDAVIEDTAFAAQMEEVYLRDLANSTEVVLDDRRKLCAPGQPRRPGRAMARGSGSTGAVAAGAMRFGNAVGAVLSDRRVLGPVQARLTILVGFVLCVLSVLVAIFPRVLAFPAAAGALWGGLALLWRGIQLRRRWKRERAPNGNGAGRELVQSRDGES